MLQNMERFCRGDADSILPLLQYKTEESMDQVFAYIEVYTMVSKTSDHDGRTIHCLMTHEGNQVIDDVTSIVNAVAGCEIAFNGCRDIKRDGLEHRDMYFREVTARAAAKGEKFLKTACAQCSIPKPLLRQPEQGRCSACTLAPWYCSRTCQKAHWAEHKAECRANLKKDQGGSASSSSSSSGK